jgi:hypothetical protein
MGWLGLAGVLLLALHAVRVAVVGAWGERRPDVAHALWPAHPLPQRTLALAEIGAAARRGESPTATALERMERSAHTDPLSGQPLLVAATERLAARDAALGERLLLAALHRDPRSTATHFLLADLYVRQQRIGDALKHVAPLGRLLGDGRTDAFAGALATYVGQPGALEKVRPVLQQSPTLRREVMTGLASDPAAATTLRALVRPGDAGERWLAEAFERHLANGDVAAARALLAAAGVQGGGTVLTAWPAGAGQGPLRWRFPADKEGAAEPVANGPLRLVYYGRADAALADHLLLLTPGRYSLQATFAGLLPAGTFEWRMSCVQGGAALMSWPVVERSGARTFEVPADCPAQRLALWGRTGEFPRTSAVELIRATLNRDGGGR